MSRPHLSVDVNQDMFIARIFGGIVGRDFLVHAPLIERRRGVVKGKGNLMKDLITLQSGGTQAEILTLGATLCSLTFEQGRNLVLGFADPADYAGIPIYAGAVVGPVANRLSGGQVVIDGQVHKLPVNEPPDTCLHGGANGLHAQIWQIADQADDQVTLTCDLEDGACGLPGKRHIKATYRLELQSLRLTLRATTDRTTLMNPAHHPYWTLTESLQIAAEKVLLTDHGNLPTGAVMDVHGPFDLRMPGAIGSMLDHCFCLNGTQPAARLTASDGHWVEVETGAPGLQVYAGAFLPDMPSKKCRGARIHPGAGTALEPQKWPDAPRHPHFPDITLHPEETFEQTTIYRFGTASIRS